MSLSSPKVLQNSPSNGSLVQDEYTSPLFRQQYKPVENFTEKNPIFANKSDLKRSNQYKIRPKSYLIRNTTQFSNTLIKSKVLVNGELYKEPIDLKLSARTEWNPECYDFVMKSARVARRQRGMDYINLSRRQTNKSQTNKKPVLDQFKYLIKESQKYLIDLPRKSLKIINSSKGRISVKTENNQPNLVGDRPGSKMRKKTNPNMTHKAFFDFEDQSEKKTNNSTPIVLTFGKYKTIHQRSHSFARKKLELSKLWL